MEYRLLRPSSHPLFRPIPAVKGSKVFSSIVVVISCFNDYDRVTLGQLIREFGGEVQETLTRRNQSDKLAVTHVIGGSEGDRVTEARRQKYKVVDPSWVIESIINDKLMDENQFPLKGEAYVSYKGRTDDLWPEAVKSADNNPQGWAPRDDFSDLIVDELQQRTPDQSLPRRIRASTPSTGRSIGKLEAPRTSTPISAVPSRLRTLKLNDRTLDMNKPFKPNFRGLTQAVEDIPSPGSTSGDTSNDNLTTSMVGRILREVAVKTAKPQRNAPVVAIASSTITVSDRGELALSTNRRSPRKSAAKQKPIAKAVCSAEDKSDRMGEMMALRARMTERLEQRNREIANQIAENGTAPSGSVSEKPTQEAGSLRGRKRGQSSTTGTAPSSKRSSEVESARLSDAEVPQPLIEWQPAMPSKLSSNSILNFEESLDVTRPPVPQVTNPSDATRAELSVRKLVFCVYQSF
ncbi:hypothetical protein GCK32_012224 [Trichostrongylus colubriformis]|uniref:BRCT domain-containing protein n=1 Tax=Trichostrongylus colubriformis TaxID=6319 RepID=A0AAN8FRP4_TRICO